MKITKIERRSPKKPQYLIYSDDVILLTVTEETLLHFQIQKGHEVDEPLLKEIHDFDQLQRCLAQAYRYLSRRNHFKNELIRKLRTKGYAPEYIDQTVQYLQEKGYLNDAELVKQFIHDAVHLKQYGPHLIKSKLLERGLKAEGIDQEIIQNYPDALQLENCRKLAVKKLKSLENLDSSKQKQKLISFLKQRGFTWETIQSVIEGFDFNLK